MAREGDGSSVSGVSPSKLPVTIWMNMPSYYQDDLFQVLNASPDMDLRVVFAKELDPERVHLGWRRGPVRYAHTTLRPGSAVREAVCRARSESGRLHIVNGIWAEAPFAAALLTLRALGVPFAIYCEAPEPNAARSALTQLTKRVIGTAVMSGATGGLAVSRFAEQFLSNLGLPADRIYPFGYFRRRPELPPPAAARKNGVEILYVGQLVHRKGLDILFAAIEPLFLEHPDLYLTVIGAGCERDTLERRHASERIRFESPVPSSLIPGRLAESDALVVPSRWDGWGLVVNEALSVGTPAVVSSCCGAAELITHRRNGYVVPSGDIEALQRCLEELLERRHEWPSLRAAALATGQSLSTEVVGPYLVECIRHMVNGGRRPLPPWRSATGVSAAYGGDIAASNTSPQR